MRAALVVGFAGLVSLALAVSGPAAGPPPNPVQAENALPGSNGWHAASAPEHAVEGYASETSVAPGATLHLHVSTAPAARYRVEIYRLGWYGGSGGRLQACVPSCTGDEAGEPQPLGSPAADGYLDAGWPVTDSLRVPGSWVSGYYLAVLRLGTGRAGRIPFLVRPPASQRSAILVQAAVNTWQAYNRWGGMSLYKDAAGASCKGVCTHVSFNRPYDESVQILWSFELPLVHFLEQSGYDVSYVTDADTDRDPSELLRHRLVVVAGHDEYWTKAMRDGFDRSRALGTNLAFMGANTGYWQMRYADDRRTVVEYRLRTLDAEPDPALKTVRFRDLVPSRPECELEGIQYVRSSAESIGGEHDYAVAQAGLSDPWFAGAGFGASSVLPGIVGYEWDAIEPGCRTPPLTPLFHFDGPPAPADAVRFTAPSGSRVFSAGSLSFARGLDEYHWNTNSPASGDPRLEAFVRNAYGDLLRPAEPQAVSVRPGRGRIVVLVRRTPDPRIEHVTVLRSVAGRRFRAVCDGLADHCVDRDPPSGRLRYAVVLRDSWGASVPLISGSVLWR
jgi:N,N-dimethylformamidase beta subunit-like, C-terminal